jgi:hypothetical protein
MPASDATPPVYFGSFASGQQPVQLTACPLRLRQLPNCAFQRFDEECHIRKSIDTPLNTRCAFSRCLNDRLPISRRRALAYSVVEMLVGRILGGPTARSQILQNSIIALSLA